MSTSSLVRDTTRAPGVPTAAVRVVGTAERAPGESPVRRRPVFSREAACRERALGSALREVRDRQAYEHVGYVRLGDYVVERLGLGYRTVQELIRVEETLGGLPRIAAAFERGELSAAHVRMLSRVADDESEARWLDRARLLDVRGLARVVAAERRRAAALTQGPSEPEPSGGRAAIAADLRDSGLDEGPETVVLSLSLPVWLRGIWRDTLTLVRNLAGAPLSAGAAFKEVLAESAAGGVAGGNGTDPDTLGSLDGAGTCADAISAFDGTGAGDCTGMRGAGGGHAKRAADDSGDPPRPGLSPEGALGGKGTDPDAVGSLDGTGVDTVVGWSSIDKACAGDCTGMREPDEEGAERAKDCRAGRPCHDQAAHRAARVLDDRLRDLVRARQSHEARTAARLDSVRAAQSWTLHGCRSLAEYALEHLGVSERQMYYLLALHRTLERLPDLARAHDRGRLTLRQTLLVGRVATRTTTSAWVRRAERITLRRLEDEVEYCEHLRELRPEVWRLLNDGPLPEGIELVPGHAPRLHVCAHRELADGLADQNDCDACGVHAGDVVTEGEADSRVLEAPGGAAVDARAFLAALATNEAAVPMPERRSTLRIRVDHETRDSWVEKVRHYRSLATEPIEEWEILALILDDFWRTWDNSVTRRQRREHPIHERDGWRCTAPGCRSVGSGALHDHHIIYRSKGGAIVDERNRTCLCTRHHLALLHENLVRCIGTAPDGLRWEMGVGAGMPPFLVYRGDVRVGGVANQGCAEGPVREAHA